MQEFSTDREKFILQTVDVVKTVTTADTQLTILESVNLSIQKGESVAIVGASGSGKSTLLGLLAGLDLPSQGDVFMAGERLNMLDEDGRALLRSQHVGFVFQSFQLLPSLTAQENVMLPMELAGHDDCAQQAVKLLESVGLGHRLSHYPKQLSGGEQQRVALARAFAVNPQILFADEPTGNLDRATGQQVIDLLFELNKQNQTTLVLVTHDEKLADLCQRKIHVDSGKVLPE